MSGALDPVYGPPYPPPDYTSDPALAAQTLEQPQVPTEPGFPYPHVPVARGYLDRLALALGNVQRPPSTVSPGDTGPAGLAALLSGAAGGFSSARTVAMSEREKLNAALVQKAHDENAANLAAAKVTAEQTGAQKTHATNRLFDIANHEPGSEPLEIIQGPTGPVYAPRSAAAGKVPYQKPEKAGAPVAVIDPATGKAIYTTPDKAVGMQPAKGSAAAGDFDPNDYIAPDKADVSPLGYHYVNLGNLPDKKQQMAVADLARKQGVPVITGKEKAALDLVDKARGHFADLAKTLGFGFPTDANGNVTSWEIQPLANYKGPLAQSGIDLGRVLKGVERRTGIGSQADVFKELKSYSDLAITAIQGMSALGTGMRINKDAILQTLHNNIPLESDTAEQARRKINTTIKLMNQTERSLLEAKNPAQRQAQAISAIIGAGGPKPGGFFDRALNGGR